jgi:hypothetical protein
MPASSVSPFESPALPILRWLVAEDGLSLEAHEGRLVVGPAEKLTDEHRELIRLHKPDLIALARLVDAGTQDRIRVFAAQYAARPEGVLVPAFVYRPGAPYAPHRCLSCTEPLPEGIRWGRCRRCAVAWRLVVGAPVREAWMVAYDSALLAS